MTAEPFGTQAATGLLGLQNKGSPFAALTRARTAILYARHSLI